MSGNQLLLNIATPQRGIPSTLFVVTLCIVKGIFLLHIVVSIRGIPQNRFVLSLCILKGIFLGVEIGVCSISRRLKWHIVDSCPCYAVYIEGKFLGGDILHIAASMRGISLKRFVVNLLY